MPEFTLLYADTLHCLGNTIETKYSFVVRPAEAKDHLGKKQPDRGKNESESSVASMGIVSQKVYGVPPYTKHISGEIRGETEEFPLKKTVKAAVYSRNSSLAPGIFLRSLLFPSVP